MSTSEFRVMLDEQSQRLEHMMDEKVSEVRDEFSRYVGVIYEDFSDKVQLLAENVMGLHERFDRFEAENHREHEAIRKELRVFSKNI